MPKGPFLPSEFVPTKFSTAQDKADFGNAFLHFIESEWVRTAFTKSFYNRLSMCFSHIAHFDAAGFYETWFTSDAERLRFLRHTLVWPCWGEPTVCAVFSPRKADEVRHALRIVERFVAFNCALFQLVEEIQGWEKCDAGTSVDRGEPSLRAA